MELTPCTRCRRHVRDEVCPFCGAHVVMKPQAIRLGRVSRAVVFGAALTATACGGKQKAGDEAPPHQHAGGGGCSQPDQAHVEELKQRRAQAQTEDEKRALDQEIERAQMPVCMPYGAPPARRRIV
jgi:hypothetical protein